MKKKTIFRAACLAAAACLSIGLFAGCVPSDRGGDGNTDGVGDNNGDDNTTTTPETFTYTGWYTLQKKTVEGVDVTGEYIWGALQLEEGGAGDYGSAKWYETDYSGITEQEGIFIHTETSVSIQIGASTVYEFAYNKETDTLSCSRKVNKQDISWVFARDKSFTLPTAEGGVAFTDELFGEDKSTENFYNYCPTVLMEGNNVMHVWYCSNKTSGQVTDYIAYRKGTLNAAGKWEFTEKTLVVAPSETTGDWDDKHICDPTVVKGEFKQGNETYSYLMAFLGAKYGNKNQNGATVDVNEVGIAVAKSPEGPWIKLDDINPICNFFESSEFNPQNYTWGYGQPSLVSVDSKGTVLLFYTKGIPSGTFTYVEKWDLSDLSNPVKLNEARVSTNGAAGSPATIRNADFAYDPVNQKLYCVYDPFPDYNVNGYYYPVVASQTILGLELGNAGLDYLFTAVNYPWVEVGTNASGRTHSALNHNAGIVTDAYGRLVNPYRIPILYTAADLRDDYPDWQGGGQWPFLHTYRLHGTVFTTK